MELYNFPSVQKTIEDFINDDDGNITRSQMVTIGTLVLVMSIMSAIDAYAKHSSHGSHGSHQSHSSTSYIRTHSNHGSHSDHGSHQSHSSHTSHSNTASHSNSRYSSEGDVTYGPSVSTIPGIAAVTRSNSSMSLSDAATTDSVTASISNNPLPEVPNVPDVPDTIAMGTINNVAFIAPMAVDPNHSKIDDIKGIFTSEEE